jgi:multidrug efflux system outer membrane protein
LTYLSPSLSRLGTALLALSLTACVAVTPDRHPASERAVPQSLADPALAIGPDAWPSPAWWTGYGDSKLNALIEQGLRAAPSLDVVKARIDAAYAAAAMQQAQHGGQASLDAGLNRQRYSGNGLFPEPIGGSFYSDATVGLKASYDVDWWGKHRAQFAVAMGEVNARRAEQAQARQLLAAAIARSYVELQFLRARQDNTGQQLKLAQAMLAERNKRIARGLARIDEQQAAQVQVAGLEQQAVRLAAASGREREMLRALAGGDQQLLEPLPVGSQAARHIVPDTLGMQLLAHRADLQAARYRVEASLGRIAASRAAFYPDFNLVGGIGLNAVSLDRLLQANSLTVLASVAMQLPVFDNGRLGAALDSVRAQRNEAVAEYNQAVVNAVRDVGQQAHTLRGIDDELARQASAGAAARALLTSAQLREKHGLGEHASTLQAEAATLAQADTALQLRQAQRQAEINLNQTLGGGFDAAAFTPSASLAQQRHD